MLLHLLRPLQTTSTTPGGARPAHLRDAGAHQPAADDRHMLDQDLLGGRRRRGRRGGHGADELPGHERHSSVEQRRRSSADSARGPGALWAGSVTLGAEPRERPARPLDKLQVHPLRAVPGLQQARILAKQRPAKRPPVVAFTIWWAGEVVIVSIVFRVGTVTRDRETQEGKAWLSANFLPITAISALVRRNCCWFYF